MILNNHYCSLLCVLFSICKKSINSPCILFEADFFVGLEVYKVIFLLWKDRFNELTEFFKVFSFLDISADIYLIFLSLMKRNDFSLLISFEFVRIHNLVFVTFAVLYHQKSIGYSAEKSFGENIFFVCLTLENLRKGIHSKFDAVLLCDQYRSICDLFTGNLGLLIIHFLEL